MKKFGLIQDNDPHILPEGASRYNFNVNLVGDSAVGEESTLQKDIPYGAALQIQLPDCIGRIPIDEARTLCIFLDRGNSAIAGAVKVEFGILSEDGTYQVAVKFTNSNNIFLTTDTRLQGTFKINYLGEVVIYWVDNLNNPRWLNITSPQVEIDANRIVIGDLDKLLVFPKYSQTRVSQVDTSLGGSLFSGSYEIALRYGSKELNYTSYFGFCNPIDVVSAIPNGLPTQFDGDIPNTATGKQITFTVGDTDFPIDTTFAFLSVAVGANINGVTTWYDYGDFGITGTTLDLNITNLIDKPIIADQQTLVSNVTYDRAKTLTQLDDYLYLGNLSKNPLTEFQPYVNNIKVEYITEDTEVNPSAQEDYRNTPILFMDKSFMWNEVYAFYIAFVFNNGEESKAYHIPGRGPEIVVDSTGTANTFPINGDPTSQLTFSGAGPGIDIYENTLLSTILAIPTLVASENTAGFNWSPANELNAISSNSRYCDAFNTADYAADPTILNMGFFENYNEFYPSTTDWDIKDSSGVITGTLQGEKVRHHKFPHAAYSSTTITTLGGSSDVNTYQSQKKLGIRLQNIIIPPADEANISGIRIYYAKRTQQNKTILGQSILIDEAGYQYADDEVYSVPNTLHIGANLRIENIPEGVVVAGPYQRVFPTSEWNETSLDTWANLNLNSPFKDLTGVDTYKEFISLHNFDNLAFSTNVNSAAYIRPVYKVNSRYDWNSSIPVDSTTPILSDTNVQVFIYNNFADSVSGVRNGTVTKHAQKNSIRRFNNPAVYMPANLQGNQLNGNTYRDWTTYGPLFDKSSNPRNYYGEQYILGELVNRIADETTAGTTRPAPRVDSAVTNCSYISDISTGLEPTNPDAAATFYLTDLCIFKDTMYQGFDNQELVDCSGIIKLINSNPSETDSILGGDTVINFYGFRSSCELGGVRNSSAGNDALLIFSFLHYFICQSSSNINYRYEDPTNSSKIYYPKSPLASVLTLSPTVDNWFGYDSMHSKLNDIRQPDINALTPTATAYDFPNRVLRSDKNNPESLYDNFLAFAANDYIDVGKNKGPVWLLSSYANRLLIHLTRSLFITAGREVLKTQNLQAYIGSGDIFEVKPLEQQNVDTGFAGIQHQWAGIITPYGYFFPDNESGKVFVFNGKMQEVSQSGMEDFFRETYRFRLENFVYDNLSLTTAWSAVTNYTATSAPIRYNNKIYIALANTLNEQPDSYPNKWSMVVDLTVNILNQDDPIKGIGIHATYDVKYKRTLLTKRDYMLFNGSTLVWPTNYLTVFNPIRTAFANGFYLYNGRITYIASTVVLNSATWKTTQITVAGSPFTIYYWDDMRDFDNAVLGTTRFKPYHYTLSFHIDDPTWGSFMVYTPETYISVGNRYFSYNTNNNFRHNSSDLATLPYLNIYNTNSDMITEPVINEPKSNVKVLGSVSLETKSYDIGNVIPRPLPRNATPARQVLETFTTYQVYDSYQISEEVTGVNTSNQRYVDGYWNINDFRDSTLNNSNPLFITDGINRTPNTANIDPTKHWSLKKRFVDYWFGVRLKYSGNNKFVFLNIFANIKKNAR